MPYYKVKVKCGHVGKGKYIPITFAIFGKSEREAKIKAKKRPRVKHTRSDAIISIDIISEKEYSEINKANSKDPYLSATNKLDMDKIMHLIKGRIKQDIKDNKKIKHKSDNAMFKGKIIKIKKEECNKGY